MKRIRSLTIDLNPLTSGLKSPKSGAKGRAGVVFDGALMSELAQLTETHITLLPDDQVSPTKLN